MELDVMAIENGWEMDMFSLCIELKDIGSLGTEKTS